MIAAMLHILAALALIAQQTAPVAAGGDLTRMLNGGVPATTTAPRTMPAPRTVRPAPTPTVATTTSPTTATTTTPAVRPSVRPVTATTTTAPATLPTPAVEAVVEAVEPPPPAPVVLDARAVAALPFTATLPTGFSITTGRPGPDFSIYTIRRGGQPFVMVYTGSASQFPIYSGERVEAGGRSSIVTNEDGHRVALEHLFTRTTAPREIHVWITSLDGADRLLAEQIGQSIDAR